jgi:hypothetical protein
MALRKFDRFVHGVRPPGVSAYVGMLRGCKYHLAALG